MIRGVEDRQKYIIFCSLYNSFFVQAREFEFLRTVGLYHYCSLYIFFPSRDSYDGPFSFNLDLKGKTVIQFQTKMGILPVFRIIRSSVPYISFYFYEIHLSQILRVFGIYMIFYILKIESALITDTDFRPTGLPVDQSSLRLLCRIAILANFDASIVQ